MKIWRPGITAKLFLAIFATCIVLLISMHWAVRISFERGFIDYIKRGNEQRLQLLSDALSEQYAQHGDWGFLRNNDRFIFQILRSFERDNEREGGPWPRRGRNMVIIMSMSRRRALRQNPVMACRHTAGGHNFG